MRLAALFIAAFIAAAASSSSPAEQFTPTAETRSYAQTYRTCVVAKAQQLERSGAEPSDVTAASLTSCAARRKDLQASLFADAVIQESEGKARVSSERIERALQEVDRRLSAEAKLKLLEARAKRRSR